jgi:hypothetical protein
MFTLHLRLRWLVPPVILFDTLMTLLGQPASYWQQPATAVEGNAFFGWFIVRGLTFFLVTSALYVIAAFLLSSYLPRRLATVAALAFILGHYFGASSWLAFSFGFGVSAAVLYGTLLAVVLTWMLRPAKAAEASRTARQSSGRR